MASALRVTVCDDEGDAVVACFSSLDELRAECVKGGIWPSGEPCEFLITNMPLSPRVKSMNDLSANDVLKVIPARPVR